MHVVDSLVNASVECLRRVRALTGAEFGFTQADIRDGAALRRIVRGFDPEVAIHFAGLKAVGDSVREPLEYYSGNVCGTVELLAALRGSRCRRMVFSSSATVYGAPAYLPLDEDHPLRPTSPYGRTKLFIEEILRDLAASDPGWSIALLRYFNPVGAHPSGLIGEDPVGVPNNLVPFIAQVAVGRRPAVVVFGDDYDTPDGTGVRDYIHVQDVARAHLDAVDWTRRAGGCAAFNLGSGRGYSVLEIVRAMAEASGRDIPVTLAPRRAGDVATMYANADRAGAVLGWRPDLSLGDMCRSVWRWQSGNPQGYPQDEAAPGVGMVRRPRVKAAGGDRSGAPAAR